MVRPSKRSRSFRRVRRKTPGGKVVTHFVEKKPKRSHCSSCGAILAGIPRVRPSKMQGIPKSSKRPQRPFGGILCTKCSRRVIIEHARK